MSATIPPAPFVVGVSRSGTTLLRLQLDAHPQMAVPPETHFLIPVLRHCDRGSPTAWIDVAKSTSNWADFHVDEDALRARIASTGATSLADGVRCFYRAYADRFGKSRWGDKTPQYTQSIQAIAELLPEAHFIHLVRDGRDVALSLHGLWFAPAPDIVGIGRAWANQVTATRWVGSRVPHYLEVRYEDLVADPRTALARICRYLQMPFDEHMLEAHRSAAERLSELVDRRMPDGSIQSREKRLEIHQRTSSPVSTERVGLWRERFDEAMRNQFNAVAGSVLQSLGYPLR